MKMKDFFVLLLLTISINTYAQNNYRQTDELLDTIQINGYGKQNINFKVSKIIHVIKIPEIQLKTIESISELLDIIASVDVRTRGSKGVQSDVAIRGGNFDQTLILLNGIPVNNPQTGHHGLDLPIDFNMLEKIEIIEGTSGQSFGVNAYSGAINLITKNPDNEQAKSSIKVGQFGYMNMNLDLSHSLGKISVYNGFSYKKSSGYLTGDSINNTDFFSIKDFIHIKYNNQNFPLFLQAGYHQKDFGANSFYTSKFPWQFEKTSGYFAALYSNLGKKVHWKPEVSYKLHYDEFQLFRESIYTYQNGYFVHKQDTAAFAPGIYYPGHNYHKTQNFITALNISFSNKYGDFSGRISWQNNQIWSNKLGKALINPIIISPRIVYNKFARRSYWTTHLNYTTKWKNISLGTALNLFYEKHFGFYPGGGFFINYSRSKFTYYASINSAERLPTFTDLYYQGPNNTGNPNLKPETAISYETGTKYHFQNRFFSLSLFFRDAQHTIDWIKTNPDDKWQTRNLTRLKTYGLSLNGTQKFNNKIIDKIRFSYTYLTMDKDKYSGYISKYVLDYLKHKFVLDISHRFFFDTKMNWTAIYKDRNGQYLDYINGQYRLFDYTPYFLTNLKLTKRLNRTRLGIGIENVFDITYRDLSYIRMPGRWIIFELTYKIK
jgi:iron complex outermembrane receptor protein